MPRRGSCPASIFAGNLVVLHALARPCLLFGRRLIGVRKNRFGQMRGFVSGLDQGSADVRQSRDLDIRLPNSESGMTGSLLLIQFYRTTLRVALAEIDEDGLISRIAHLPYGYLFRVIQQISRGTFRTDEQLFKAARHWMWVLGRLRRLNAYMRGKGAERRAALLVLLRYSFGLMLIAALAVLFWSFVIRLSSSSTITTADALLASAARMVPGVAGPEAIKVTNFVQTGASLTAWFVFVLYAGPMASMFPILLERYMKKISEANDKLRAGRRLIYTFADAFRRLENRMSENPTTSVQSSPPDLVPSDSANSPN
jgi:hypothetical protein